MSNLARVGDSKRRRKTPVNTATGASRLKTVGTTRQSGFSLIEILIAISIILTLAALAVPNYLAALDRAKDSRAVGDIRTIGNSVLGYEIINHVFPDDLSQVGYGSNLDPWGQPYQYMNFATTTNPSGIRKDRFNVPLNAYFDLYSMGKDKLSSPPLTATVSQDDVVWAADGGFDGLATDY
ncbi:MAG: prepilin-type N-terminal cleavage/methylation domain-containing protein [Acidobacteriia bacterium]|nr:prepilin-type N-terminal cleavage/methylation domain-containing protein [Terriglobia bacterium]